uniref:Uncharacterized protein n=1 Tax=Panagrellus redivivus TaxID=6233 RepID=A0A7E4VDQ0_PANRE
MVYPIAALPYSSQRRMRELAQPRELYHLQLADIDDTLYLNPLQLVRHDSMFARYRRNGRARATEPLTDTEFQEKTMLILIDDIVMLKEIFSSSVFEDSKLQYYKFESGKVGLSNCIINVGVLNGLKTWIPNCPDFFFYVCSIEEGVTLASIINTYPMATSLRFSSCQLPDNFLIGLKSVLKTEKACKVRIICQNQPNWLNKNIAADIVDFLWVRILTFVTLTFDNRKGFRLTIEKHAFH